MQRDNVGGRLLAFGSTARTLDLPGGESVADIVPSCPPPSAPAPELIRAALENPLGSSRLRVMARGLRTAVILVPGKDRVAAANTYLPLILNELNEAGIPDDGISAVLATGTHIKHSPEEIRQLIGEEAGDRILCRQHNCQDGDHLKTVGVTRYGTPVELDRATVDADLRVLTGRIIPHYFAGFGGGRKAVLPGVASVNAILHNHRLTLDSQRGIHPGIRPCALRDNPVHLDMLEAARLAGPSFVLNTVLDNRHRVVAAVSGNLEAAHLAGCRQVEKWFKVEIDQPVDAVVTSAGGWPYDCDFVQSLKAVFDVQDIVKPDGAILWIAEARGGMKEAFLRLAAIGDDRIEEEVRAHYSLAAHNTIMLRRLLRRTRVALYSGLPDVDVGALGLVPIHSMEEGIDWLRDVCPRNFCCAVAPFANITYAALRPGSP